MAHCMAGGISGGPWLVQEAVRVVGVCTDVSCLVISKTSGWFGLVGLFLNQKHLHLGWAGTAAVNLCF